MSVRTNLKLVTLITLLLVASACSKDKKSSANAREPQKNAECAGIECFSSVTWKILLQGNVFPRKTRVEINGNTVLDECQSKPKYKIDRRAAPQSLTLENYTIPKAGHVKIHIVDQGWDCTQDTAFLTNDDVHFEVVKGAMGSEEVLINL